MSLAELTSNKNFLSVVVVITGLMYFPLNQKESRHYWETRVDPKIPLLPFFIIPYVILFFPYLIIGPALLIGTDVMESFLKSFIIANIAAYIIWHFFPNGVRRPVIKVDGFWKKVINDLYKFDKHDTNGFPSGHVYYSSIISWYLSLAFPQFSFIIFLVGGLIIVSTLFTKQHYIVDVIGGIGLSIFSILIVGFIN